MAKKKPAKKPVFKTKAIIKTESYKVKHDKTYMFLTVCADCKIRLVVFKEYPTACSLCKSANIAVSLWK